MPNTEVKLIFAEDTWRVTAWKNRVLPTLSIYSSLAQSVEHSAVNRVVVGSSPTRGAKKIQSTFVGWIFLLFFDLNYHNPDSHSRRLLTAHETTAAGGR